jgi:anti-anti-sigma regulatory factor
MSMAPSESTGTVRTVDREPNPLKFFYPRIGLDEADEVLQQITLHIHRSPADVSVDMSEVQEASSVAVAVLVRAGQIAHQAGKRLILLAGSPIINCLLKINHLDRFLHRPDKERSPND